MNAPDPNMPGRAVSTGSHAVPSVQGHVVLIGYRGCGKTTIGSVLARRLGRDLIDTDTWIERSAGRAVAEIFRVEGEAAFRARETDAIAWAVAQPPAVISVGGGAVLAEHNRRLLAAAGVCIWLRAGVDELLRRLALDPRSATLRPALTASPPRDEIERLLAERTPLYQQLARLTVQTDQREIATIVNDILHALTPAHT